MITVFKNKKMPYSIEKFNDTFFNKVTVSRLDDRANAIVSLIDQSELIDKYKFKSRFDGTVLNTDKLSSGCKTVLNIMYNTDRVFDIRECGENALDYIYAMEEGKVFCEYPMISFNMKAVLVYDKKELRVIDDYDELKEWWLNEN